jgi:hypothetical protein
VLLYPRLAQPGAQADRGYPDKLDPGVDFVDSFEVDHSMISRILF